ncbi:hypothetical protein LAZ67_6004040 [Cordylochernes scorpioides]|uniref:FHA domain-containing protein n=1 Tax=Cordylochernes scorpioides TaxID=51811 RepID=A0ABY6KM59_9ARAC|nr:hypothetical protein LAZ67_6004040 [Cordylochernes scorpioides]
MYQVVLIKVIKKLKTPLSEAWCHTDHNHANKLNAVFLGSHTTVSNNPRDFGILSRCHSIFECKKSSSNRNSSTVSGSVR